MIHSSIAQPAKDVTCIKKGTAGLITLSRSHALNALTHGMCLEIEAALERWETDPDVQLVIIDAEGEKAFCAGGDIVALFQNGKNGNHAFCQTYWRDEYRMNHMIAAYAKPVVSFLHGIVMGGGVGLGCHCSHRIGGSSLMLALPECAIGLAPDVGATKLLRNAPSGVGKLIGTTGYRMDADDALLSGLIDGFIPEENWRALKDSLIAEGDPAAISAYLAEPQPGVLRENSREISSCFGTGTIDDTLYLMEYAGEWGGKARKALRAGSPISIRVTESLLNSLDENSSLADALRNEFRFTYRASADSDFLEGVRAKLIDRDNAPQWKFPNLNEVPEELVRTLLAPLGSDELQFKEKQQ